MKRSILRVSVLILLNYLVVTFGQTSTGGSSSSSSSSSTASSGAATTTPGAVTSPIVPLCPDNVACNLLGAACIDCSNFTDSCRYGQSMLVNCTSSGSTCLVSLPGEIEIQYCQVPSSKLARISNFQQAQHTNVCTVTQLCIDHSA